MPAPKQKSNGPEYTQFNGRNVRPALIAKLRGAVYEDGEREIVCDANGNYKPYKSIPKWESK